MGFPVHDIDLHTDSHISCPDCGGPLAVKATIIAGKVEFDIREQPQIKPNYPDWLTGILAIDEISCQHCGKKIDLKISISPTVEGIRFLKTY